MRACTHAGIHVQAHNFPASVTRTCFTMFAQVDKPHMLQHVTNYYGTCTLRRDTASLDPFPALYLKPFLVSFFHRFHSLNGRYFFYIFSTPYITHVLTNNLTQYSWFHLYLGFLSTHFSSCFSSTLILLIQFISFLSSLCKSTLKPNNSLSCNSTLCSQVSYNLSILASGLHYIWKEPC